MDVAATLAAALGRTRSCKLGDENWKRLSTSDIARTFSLASSPHDHGSIMIAMRMRVSEFKTTLLAAPNGTKFEVSRARGSFALHQDPQRPAVFSH